MTGIILFIEYVPQWAVLFFSSLYCSYQDEYGMHTFMGCIHLCEVSQHLWEVSHHVCKLSHHVRRDWVSPVGLKNKHSTHTPFWIWRKVEENGRLLLNTLAVAVFNTNCSSRNRTTRGGFCNFFPPRAWRCDPRKSQIFVPAKDHH